MSEPVDATPPRQPVESRLEPLGALVRRATRRAALALFMLGVVALAGGRWPGWSFVAQALLGASGLVVLAVLARAASRRPFLAYARSLTLGFVAPAWALATYVAGAQLRAIGETGDVAAGWAAAQAAVQRLSHELNSADLVVIVSVAVGASVATSFFSDERDCGPVALVPLPALSLLVLFGHAGSIPFALFGAFSLSAVLTMLFHVAERPRPRLLGGDRRDGDAP